MSFRKRKLLRFTLGLGCFWGAANDIAGAEAYLKGPVIPGTYEQDDDIVVWYRGDSHPSTISPTPGDYTFNAINHTIDFTGRYQDQGNQGYAFAPENSTVTVNANEIIFSDVTVQNWSWSNDANGLSARVNTDVLLNGNVTVKNIKALTNDMSADTEGIEISNNSTVQINGTLNMSGLSSTTNLVGLSLDNKASLKVSGSAVLTDVIGNTNGNTTGAITYGANLLSNSQVVLDQSLTIGTVSSQYGKAYGISTSDADSLFSVGNNLQVDSVVGAQSAHGLETTNSGKIIIQKDLRIQRISSSSGSAIGLASDGANSEILVKGNVKIDNVSGAIDSIGLATSNGGSIKINKGFSFNNSSSPFGSYAAGSPLALYSTGTNSNIALNTAQSGVVQITGNIQALNNGNASLNLVTNDSFLTGDLVAGSSGTTNLTMTAGTFTGIANQEHSGTGHALINMTENSRWNMTGDWNADLTMTGGGHLYFHDNSFMSVIAAGIVKINGGTIHFDADIPSQTSDRFIISSGIQGTGGFVAIPNYGSAATTGKEKLILIEDKVYQGALFTLANQVELGGHIYDLGNENIGDEKQWFLFSRSKRLSTTASAGVNVFSGNYLLNYAETQILLRRMGDLRDGQSKGNLWARAFGGKFDADSKGFLGGYDMTYQGLQVGADRKISLKNAKGNLYFGGMFGFTNGSFDYGYGSGSADSKTLGVYGTYMAPSGFYTDLVLKYGWMKNDYFVLDTAGNSVKGNDIKNNSTTLSLEFGKRLHFDSKAKEGWYIEPQAQLSISHHTGNTFTASNGLRIEVDSFNSTLGRIGANIGYEVKSGKNPINAYAKVSYLHEFNGDVGYKLNSSALNTSYGDSWWTMGLGITATVKEKHNLYLDIERSAGGSFRQTWALNGGYRFSW